MRAACAAARCVCVGSGDCDECVCGAIDGCEERVGKRTRV